MDWIGIAGESRYYMYGPSGEVLFEEVAGYSTLYATLTDHLGTYRDLVNTSGTIVNHLVYDAYGKIVSETTAAPNSPRVRFTGQLFDYQAGLNYHHHRWYDPQAGRWISEDPIGFGGGDVNLSRYVSNSSSNFTDPTGLDIYLSKGQAGRFDPVGVIHQDIAVDTWEDGGDCGGSKRTGIQAFSFGVADEKRLKRFGAQNNWLGFRDVIAVGLFGLPAGFHMEGIVYKSTFDPNQIVSRLRTTPAEDRAFLKHMERRVGTRDRYTVLWHNCVNYTNHEFGVAKRMFGFK
jgi:RHS repeat-associated protein